MVPTISSNSPASRPSVRFFSSRAVTRSEMSGDSSRRRPTINFGRTSVTWIGIVVPSARRVIHSKQAWPSLAACATISLARSADRRPLGWISGAISAGDRDSRSDFALKPPIRTAASLQAMILAPASTMMASRLRSNAACQIKLSWFCRPAPEKNFIRVHPPRNENLSLSRSNEKLTKP